MAIDFNLVIPSRDGLPHVFLIAREYVRLDLAPHYFVDGRSSGLFRGTAPRLLAHTTLLSPTGASIEEMLPEIVARTSAPWVLRIDDDEAPSLALRTWLADVTPAADKTVIAFPRRAVRFDEGAPVYARSIPKLTEYDYQYRAFRRASAVFDPTLHTAGIRFSGTQVVYAPPDCCLYHFDWIVRTRAQREAKLFHYESLKHGSWDSFDFQYLPEDFSAALYDYTPLDDPEIARLAKRLRLAQRLHGFARRMAGLSPVRIPRPARHAAP